MTHEHDLKAAGLKATLPRMKVLELFHKSKVRHMTAEDVYRLLMEEGLDVGLATIYRVLTQFEQAGILKRHHFEGGKSIFELSDGERHDHIVCVNTGQIVEFHDPEIERRIEKVVRDHGFELVDHVLHIRALAPAGKSTEPPGSERRGGQTRIGRMRRTASRQSPRPRGGSPASAR